MLDSGADTDFIDEKIIVELGIDTWEKEMTVVTVDQNFTSNRRMANFSIESIDEQYEANIGAALVGHLVTGAADIPPAKRDCSSYHHLKDIVFDEAEGGVEMIIGAGHAEAWMGGETRMGPTGEPVGISTL